MADIKDVNEEELNHCQKVFNSKYHYKQKRRIETVSTFNASKDKDKRPNNAMEVDGVQYTPLLLGKVQLGNVTNVQRELIIEELLIRGISVDTKEKITKMKELLVNNEFPNTLNWKKEKFFTPKLFTAPDWSRDVVDETMTKLNELRRLRTEG